MLAGLNGSVHTPLWAVGRASAQLSVRERIQFENRFRLKSFQNWTI